MPQRGRGPLAGPLWVLSILCILLVLSVPGADAGKEHKCSRSGRDYTRPCPIVFAPQPYCFCIANPSNITCAMDAGGNVVGVTWGGGAWMHNTWDELTRNQTIYYPPASGSELEPGINHICMQSGPMVVTNDSVVFPRDYGGAGSGPPAGRQNRIKGLIVRYDALSGYISQLTFVFNWILPGSSPPEFYTSSCGAGSTYTGTKYYAANPETSSPFYESVLCGMRAQCLAPRLGKGGAQYPTRRSGRMMMPLLACWSEELRNTSRTVLGNETNPFPAPLSTGGGSAPDAHAPPSRDTEEEETDDATESAAVRNPTNGPTHPSAPLAPPQQRQQPRPGEGGHPASPSPATTPREWADAPSPPGAPPEGAAGSVSGSGQRVECGDGPAARIQPKAFLAAKVAPDRWSNMPAAAAPAAAGGPSTALARLRGERRRQQQKRQAAMVAAAAVHSGGGNGRALKSVARVAEDPKQLAGWAGLKAGPRGTGSLDPALAVGAASDGRAFALHSAAGLVALYALDAATGTPSAAHAPRQLSSFFAPDGFVGIGAQGGYRSPSAVFDKAARRFVLAAASQAAAAPAGGADATAASSVLWVGVSQKTDPRQEWRILALPAPGPGDASNPCAATGRAAVWESPQVGYDANSLLIGVTIACAPLTAAPAASDSPPLAASDDPAARSNRQTWLLAIDKAALYQPGGAAALTVVAWDVTNGIPDAVAQTVTPAVPQSAADAATGPALAVAVDSAPGQGGRLLFYAVTDTIRLQGLSPSSSPSDGPTLCQAARPRGYSPPQGQADGGTGKSWHVYSAALHDSRLHVATHALASDCSAAACRPAVHISSWDPLQGNPTLSGGGRALSPSAAGPGALLQDASAGLAFPAVAVPPSGRPVVGFSRLPAAAGGDASSGGTGYARLSPEGALSLTAALQTARTGAAVDADDAHRVPTAAPRPWGDRTAVDVLGSRVYVAAPVGPTAGGPEATWISVLDDSAA